MPEPARRSRSTSSPRSASAPNLTPLYQCNARLVSKKKLKSSEVFSQDGVENFVRKPRKSSGANYMLHFLQDRILYKPPKQGPKAPNHDTVYYTQIMGAFSVVNFPNMIILGIEYPARSKRKYEASVFTSVSNADQVRRLLLEVTKQSDRILREFSTDNHASGVSERSLPRLSMHEECTQISQTSVEPTNVYESKDTTEDDSTPPPLVEAAIENNRLSHVSSSPIIPSQTHIDRKHVQSLNIPDRVPSVDIKTNELISHKRPISLPNLSEEKWFNSELLSRNGWEPGDRMYLILTALSQERRDDVLFLTSNEYSGTQIAEYGPIYMICRREPVGS